MSTNKTKCLVHNGDINVPCNLSGCPLYTDNRHFLNCINHYMHVKELDGLSASDISLLIGTHQSDVNIALKSSIETLREQAISSSPLGMSSNFDIVYDFIDMVDPITEAPNATHGMKYVYSVESKFKNYFPDVIEHLRPLFSDVGTILKSMGMSRTESESAINLFDL